jgi:hypothetical protein
MRRLAVLAILLVLISSIFVAGCVFQEEEKKEKKTNGDNEPDNGDENEVLNITEISHEPSNPTETDDVIVTVKIEADYEIESVLISFCDVSSGICTLGDEMTVVTGTEDTYNFTLAAGNYKSGTDVSYHVTVTDSEDNNDAEEKTFTIQ